MGMHGRVEEQLELYDEVAARFGAAQEPDVLYPVAVALRNKAAIFHLQGRDDAALEVLDAAMTRFEQIPVLRALIKQAQQDLVGQAE